MTIQKSVIALKLVDAASQYLSLPYETGVSTDRQRDRQAERQTGRETDRQRDRQTDRQTKSNNILAQK